MEDRRFRINQLQEGLEYRLIDALGFPGRICKLIKGDLYMSNAIEPYSQSQFYKVEATHKTIFDMEFVVIEPPTSQKFEACQAGICLHEEGSYIHVEASYTKLGPWLEDDKKVNITISSRDSITAGYADISLTLDQAEEMVRYIQQLKELQENNLKDMERDYYESL